MYGAFGRDFPTADGRRVMVVAISLRQWQSLVEATGIAEHLPAIETAFEVDLRKEGDRFEARDALAALIAPWIAARTLDRRSPRRSTPSACAGAPTRRSRQLLDEDWRVSEANPMFRDIDQPGLGKVRVGGSPLPFGALDRTPAAPAPRLGEHTDEILADELGLSATRDRPRSTTVASSPDRPESTVAVDLSLADLGLPERPPPSSTPTTSAAHRRHPRRTGGARPGEPLPACGTGRSSRRRRRPSALGPDGHPVLRRRRSPPYPRRMSGPELGVGRRRCVVGDVAERTSAVRSARTSRAGAATC